MSELQEIYNKLHTLKIPVAYLTFNTPQKTPVCVYYESGTKITGADTLNLFRRVEITVELYTDKKDVSLERKIESLFSDVELEKAVDTYLPDEEMFMTAYTFETIQKI